MADFDSHQSTEQARQRLDIRKILEQHGSGPREQGETWKKFKCPFCSGDAGGVYSKKGKAERFHCFYQPCPTNNKSLDESGLYAQFRGLSREDAWKTWLKEAGVWREEDPVSPWINKSRRKRPAPKLSPAPGESPSAPTDPEGLPTKTPTTEPAGTELPTAASNEAAPAPGSEELSTNEPSPSSETIPPAPAASESTPEAAGVQAGPESNVVQFPSGDGDGGDPIDDDEGGGGGGMSPLDDFYRQLVLADEDRKLLLEKRGLSTVVDLCGFRSNTRSNKAILEKLSERHSVEALVESGLWVGDDVPKPSAQFYGWGILGKKKRTQDDERPTKDDFEWGWCQPVLIPYFNQSGSVVALRPHKGFARGGKSRLYVVRPVGGVEDEKFRTVVICEGEFKAAAIRQVLPDVGCCSMPGISMAKYPPIQEELLAWLKAVRPERIIVAYDNEEKADKRLPSYKPDPAKRHQTQIWARFLAELLKSKGFNAFVTWLPTEWRDEKGKADWDGCLARLLNGEIKLTETGKVTVRKAFQGVLDAATAPEDFSQLTLFDKREEQVIKNGIVRLWYSPLLPFGGEKEMATARLFEKLSRNKEWAHAGYARLLARSFREVRGWYYIRVTKAAPKGKERGFFLKCKDEDEERSRSPNLSEKDRQLCRDRAKFYEEFLQGPPEGVADFYLDCRFTLVKLDGTRDRMVILRAGNGIDKTKLIALDAKSFTAPRDFKLWVENQGDFCWMTGEQELEMLRHDIHQLAAYRRVYQVAHFGWHEDSKLWIAADCAIAPDGSEIVPDNDGVLWWDGLGYLIGDTDWEGEGFKMGKVYWKPSFGLRFRKDPEGVREFELVENEQDDPIALQNLFGELVTRARETLGGYEGYLAVGSVLAYAAAPEFFGWQGWFTGIFLHGETGSGKSTFARWLMQIVGLDRNGGLKLPYGTIPGLAISAQQYCNLPIWLEEFTDTLEASRAEWLKGLYMRETPPKKEFGAQMRRILTNAIVTGEKTSTVAAMRQRFVHFQVSAKNRKGDHKEWFEENGKFFFSLWRFVLRKRREFVEAFMREWKAWCQDMGKLLADERSKGAHALGYAGFAAFATVLGMAAPMKSDMDALRRFTGEYALRAAADVREEVNVNVFWDLVVNAYRMEVFGNKEALHDCFRVQATATGAPPGYPNQHKSVEGFDFLEPWVSYRIYIEPGLLLSKLEQFLAKTRTNLPLRRRDLRDQLSMHTYWVEGNHWQRFPATAPTGSRCWCIDVDKHPLGFLPVSDEELQQRYKESGLGVFIDPRKGPLFLLVEDYLGKRGPTDPDELMAENLKPA